MITPALLLVAAIFAALMLLRLTGAHRRSVSRYAPVIICVMGAILFAARGRMMIALMFGIGAAAFYLWSIRPAPKPAQQTPPPRKRGSAMSDAQARAILGVPPGASVDQIRSAFRRRMAQAHPDQGGSTEEAARISAARDALLRR